MTRSEKTTFEGSGGGLLAGRVEHPDGPVRAWAVFAHCFTCSKDVRAASRISRALTDASIGVLRFDFTGLGGSDGDFASTDFSSNVEDLLRAARHLEASYAAPRLLVGHSLGGAAVLAAAGELDSVRAVATVGAPAGPEHVLRMLVDSRAEIEERGEATVLLAGREFCIRQGFLDDIAAQPQAERIRDLRRALLVLHSPVDDTVGVEDARAIFEAARHPKSFVSLDGADHLLTDATDATYAASVIATWASRYLGEPEPAAPSTPAAEATDEVEVESTAEGTVVVSTDGTPFGQVLRAGVHTWRADEPAPLGADTGPSPYDLVLAGLGACTSMTVRMYAARKRWPLDAVTVTLTHDRSYVDDCTDPEGRPCQLTRVARTLELVGDLDDAQRAKLVEIADKCPVHRTLTGEVVVDTTLAPRPVGS